jgi:Secretion system C-terminal sorting domain
LTANPVRVNFTNDLLTGTPTAFKVSPFTMSSTTLFVGTDDGKLLRLNNANAIPTWADITGGGFVGSVSDIEFGVTEQEILVTFHNYGVINIWYTTDGGTTWVNKEGDLPDLPVKAIMMNPLNNDEVIIGTDLGVWRTENFKNVAPNWVQSYNGMSNVKVTDLDYRTTDNTVLAATYGRGLFTGVFTASPLAIDDFNFDDNSFLIYPSLSDGYLTVSNHQYKQKAVMKVYNLEGRQVLLKNIIFNGQTKEEVSLNLSRGVYIVNVVAENVRHSQKIIIK